MLTSAPVRPPAPQYLGPLIVAQRDRPVRVKFTNQLGTGTAGNLFLPVDTTLMGAGEGPLGAPEVITPRTAPPSITMAAFTPWISDGTPHQWFTPAGETSPYLKGVSFHNVPDMPDPGAGSQTLYYTNQQSGRLMFYHDHAVGITRLNVYAGMAAGYLIHDPVEDNLITTGVIPNQWRRGLQLGYSFNHPGQNLRTPRRGHRPGYQVEFQPGGHTAISSSPTSMSRTRA